MQLARSLFTSVSAFAIFCGGFYLGIQGLKNIALVLSLLSLVVAVITDIFVFYLISENDTEALLKLRKDIRYPGFRFGNIVSILCFTGNLGLAVYSGAFFVAFNLVVSAVGLWLAEETLNAYCAKANQ
jgi:hypothetical protein